MTQNNQFNPSEHLMQIKNKNGATDYLPVQWRLVWFREQCPDGTIDTEEITVDLDREVEAEAYVWNNEKRRSEKVIKRARGYARYKAIVTDGKGGRATGTKSENAAEFPDYVEKAETGAIGRALAGLGYGTQFAPELDESHRIVDSPVERTQSGNGQQQPTITPVQQAQETHAGPTTQQLSSIDKLCELIGKPSPAQGELTFETAKELIQKLSAEYRDVQDMRREQQKQGLRSLPAQDPALVKMIANAKAKCATVQVLWEDAKVDAKLARIEDEELTVQQVAQINGVIAEYGKRMVAAK